MSKLDEMIRELCPDGAEYVKLNSVCDIYDGTHSTPNYTESGVKFASVENIGNLYATQKYISEKDFEKYKIKPRIGDVMMTRIGSVGVCTVVDRNEALAFYVSLALLRPQLDKVQSRFLKYAIESIHGRKELRKRTLINAVPIKINKDDIGKVTIPLPPIEIQSEIVRMLDSYTESVVELQRQLTAELTARKTQYAYYRDSLLSMKSQWYHVKIIDMLSQPITDGPHTTPQFVQNGVPFISVDSIWDGKIHFEKMRGYITEAFDEECCKKYKPQKNDVYMVKSGSTTGKVAFVDTDIRFNIWSPLAAMRVNEQNSARFLFYLLQTEKVQKQVKAKASHGSQPNLGMRELEQFEVDVPPLDVQNRIVEVLDNFEKICSDLNIGLPAEIEARQKQYEYYRDKLLTFVETGNTILSRAEQSRAEQSRAEQSRALIKLLQYVFGYAVVTLEDIAENCDSMRKPVTSGKREAGEYPYYGASGIVDYVKDYIFDGDYLLVSEDGANLLARSTPIAFSISGKNWVNNHAHVLKFDCYETRRFVEFYLNSIDLALYISGGAQPKLNQKNLNRIEIPLPSQERQKYIVDILDRFDAICNDLTSGLPAEIEARQKQYEYYRDKLLTFKEVAAT